MKKLISGFRSAFRFFGRQAQSKVSRRSVERDCLKRLFLLVTMTVFMSGCAVDPGKDARFGAYGGKQAEPEPRPPFDVQSTLFGARWFPAHVRWAPDDSHILVSLCHVNRATYCRIGKYWLAERRWEILNLQHRVTYRWPSYSPDGKRIVASVGGCDANYVCPVTQYALMLLSADGKRTIKLADTIAIHPTFSDNGNKLIYWRSLGGRSSDVFQFDLTTGKEQALTQLYWTGEERGWAFFLPGGERFVFAGWLPIRKQTGAGNVPVIDDLSPDVRIDPHGGPYPNVIMFAANIRDGVITRTNAKHLELLWPDLGRFSALGGAKDVSRDGLVLSGNAKRYIEEKQAGGLLMGNEMTLDSHVLMLRPAREDAPGTAAFLLPATAADAAISADGRRVAFSEANPDVWHHSRRMGIVSLGNSVPIFIDWPRLELDPAATRATE